MRIVSIFAPYLYAFHFDEDLKDVFALLFEQWSDMEFLENFFEKNKSLLQTDFWQFKSVESAALDVWEDAMAFEEEIRELAQGSKFDLDKIFRPLSFPDYKVSSWQRNKGKYGSSPLRIYALKVNNGCYIVTGGIIKLTKTIQEMGAVGNEQLERLKKGQTFLKKEGFIIK